MAYDERLAERVRALLAREHGVEEKRMFGGLGFLVGGNLAVAVSSQGGLLVRVDAGEADVLVRETSAVPMEMRGRTMRGWLRVAEVDEPEIVDWVRRGVAAARAAPAKG